MTTRFVELTRFKQRMKALSSEARKKRQLLVVVQDDAPIFEVRPVTLKTASLQRTMAAIEEGRADARAGRTVTLAQARKRFGVR